MTQNKPIHSEEIDALRRLVSSHGADRTRWPARERLRFAGLLATDAAARKLVRDEDALDRLLDRASKPSEARVEALAARIVAQAKRESRVSGPRRPASALSLGRRSAMSRGLAGAAMAACLLVGLLIGKAGVIDPAMEPFGVASEEEIDGDATLLALGLEETGAFEEERL